MIAFVARLREVGFIETSPTPTSLRRLRPVTASSGRGQLRRKRKEASRDQGAARIASV